MAGLTAFSRDLGTAQGRIEPTRWTPQDGGSWVLCLGQDHPASTETLNASDSVTVTQETSWPAMILRVPMRMRPPLPANLPLGAWWRCSLVLDGVEVVGKTLPPTRTRDFQDAGWNLSHLDPGEHTFGFRLALLGAAGAYEVEIPGFYADALAFVDIGRPALLNRDPEPSETGVPADTLIAVDVTDVGPDGIDLSSVTIRVNGAVAFTSSTIEPAFDGPGAGVSQPQADTWRFVLSPKATFASEEVVSVEVYALTLGTPISIDETYSFTVERLHGPVATVAAVDQKTIQVAFDEAVVQGDGTAEDDALNPANYSIGRTLGDCVVSLQVVAVAAIDAATVALTTDLEMTPGGDYSLTISGVRDLVGNLVPA